MSNKMIIPLALVVGGAIFLLTSRKPAAAQSVPALPFGEGDQVMYLNDYWILDSIKGNNAVLINSTGTITVPLGSVRPDTNSTSQPAAPVQTIPQGPPLNEFGMPIVPGTDLYIGDRVSYNGKVWRIINYIDDGRIKIKLGLTLVATVYPNQVTKVL